MFSFFQKKVFLQDQLEGFVDIHNHILPGIDDGAANIEASMELIAAFEKIGITRFISTPHVMNDYYPNTVESIENALKKVQEHLQVIGKEIKIKAAAEYMMDQAFLELLEKERLLCLKD